MKNATKKYWISYPRNFSNEYSLCWSGGEINAPEPGESWQRISRKEAESKCRMESWRRRYNSAMSGYAPTLIFPSAQLSHDDLEVGYGVKGSAILWDSSEIVPVWVTLSPGSRVVDVCHRNKQ